MIPKIIHYCWFGDNPLSPLALKCIESWKKHCPDYEIICWNETNFDLNYNLYVQQAHKLKKWAFVSDVARLHALVECGGIYMDTDCELLRPIDTFLEDRAFLGFESKQAIAAGIMGCEKGNILFKEFLEYYDNKTFVKLDNSLEMTTIVRIITSILMTKGLVLNGKNQIIEGFALYPIDFFYPKSVATGVLNITENSYAIHHYEGSWLDEDVRMLQLKRDFYVKIFGVNIGMKIYRVIKALKNEGFFGFIKKIIKK